MSAAPAGGAALAGGLLVRAGGELRFLPANVALRVAPKPRVTALPGAPRELLGVTLHEGAIVPVLAIGPAHGEMIVCQHAGELVGLVGGEVVRTGSFPVWPADPTGIEHAGRRVPLLDVASLYTQVEIAGGRGGWGQGGPRSVNPGTATVRVADEASPRNVRD
jgi:hypothetical protein